jgi:hypothetical protein
MIKLNYSVPAYSFLHQKKVEIIGYHVNNGTIILDCDMGDYYMMFRIEELRVYESYELSVEKERLIVKRS